MKLKTIRFYFIVHRSYFIVQFVSSVVNPDAANEVGRQPKPPPLPSPNAPR
jgi:hypothetical protein